MATSGQVIEHLAKVSGLLPSTMERMLRPLRAAEMVPMGEKGRGQQRGHYQASHLANVILAFAGHQPSDAAEIAKSLGDMVYAITRPDGAPKLFAAGETLRGALTRVISEVGHWIATAPPEGARATATPGFAPYIFDGLTLSPTLPRRGGIVWHANGKGHVDEFIPVGSYEVRGAIYQQFMLDRLLIWAACELYADTLLRTKAIPIASDLQVAASKSKTAASDLAKGRNAAVSSDQSAPTELGGPQHLHPTAERENSQPAPESLAGRSRHYKPEGPDDD